MKNPDEFSEKPWDIKYTDIAEWDLDNVHDYISETLIEPEIAEKMSNRIMDAVDELDHQPMRFRMYDHEPWKSVGLRVMTVRNYSVFYVPVETQNRVWIIRIMYSKRDFERHLKTPDDYNLELPQK